MRKKDKMKVIIFLQMEVFCVEQTPSDIWV